MVETGSGKQECKSIYSSLYIFIVFLKGLQVGGEVTLKIKWTRLLPHSLYSTCNEWIGELLGAYYFCYFFWQLRYLPLDFMLGKNLIAMELFVVQCVFQWHALIIGQELLGLFLVEICDISIYKSVKEYFLKYIIVTLKLVGHLLFYLV